MLISHGMDFIRTVSFEAYQSAEWRERLYKYSFSACTRTVSSQTRHHENQALICQSQFTWIYIFIYAFFLILATWGQQNNLLVKGKSCLSLACFVALDLHLERLSELEQYRPRGNMLTCSPSTRQKHAASGKQCYV